MRNDEKVSLPWEQQNKSRCSRFLSPRLFALLSTFVAGVWLDGYARRPSLIGITDCFCSNLQCRTLNLIDHPYLVLSYPIETWRMLSESPELMIGFLVLLFSSLYLLFVFIKAVFPEIKSRVRKLLRRLNDKSRTHQKSFA
jgi:uncharacterized membrane protein